MFVKILVSFIWDNVKFHFIEIVTKGFLYPGHKAEMFNWKVKQERSALYFMLQTKSID